MVDVFIGFISLFYMFYCSVSFHDFKLLYVTSSPLKIYLTVLVTFNNNNKNNNNNKDFFVFLTLMLQRCNLDW